MTSDSEILTRLYDQFNARDIEALLAMMREDVIWANGMEGGHVRGREGVRDYWTRQWAAINPHVEPVASSTAADGATVIEVRQTVRNLAGELLLDKMVRHVFHMEEGLIGRFDIAE
jgi:ketosteroid isomerase-like protein